MKRCTKCGETKPFDAFPRSKKTSDGRQTWCRSCFAAYYIANRERKQKLNRRWAAANPELMAAYKRRWKTANPEYDRQWYLANREHVAERNQRWAAANRARSREIKRRWSKANPESVLQKNRRWRAAAHTHRAEYLRQWRAANRERAAEQSRRRRALKLAATVPGVTFTAEQLTQRMSMFAGCWMCGGAFEHVDHVKPLSKGGPHMLANLRPACGPCNSRKNDVWPLAS